VKNLIRAAICTLFGISANATTLNPNIITHNVGLSSVDMEHEIERVQHQDNLLFSVEKTLSLLAQLNEFDLGCFLLRNKGLNGYWTSYLILQDKGQFDSPLEDWLIKKAPTVLATRERFYIFQDKAKSIIESKSSNEQINIASIPCGVLSDLLTMKFQTKAKVKFTGIDLDETSIKMAKINAENFPKMHQTQILKRDAWNLGLKDEFDIIMSNGLNIYEKDEDRLVALYKEFYKSLKTGGKLITSFLTYPPAFSKDSPWKNVILEDAQKQIALFRDILGAKWMVYRTEKEVRQQLSEAGFVVEEVIYDSKHIFPTIIAKK